MRYGAAFSSDPLPAMANGQERFGVLRPAGQADAVGGEVSSSVSSPYLVPAGTYYFQNGATLPNYTVTGSGATITTDGAGNVTVNDASGNVLYQGTQAAIAATPQAPGFVAAQTLVPATPPPTPASAQPTPAPAQPTPSSVVISTPAVASSFPWGWLIGGLAIGGIVAGAVMYQQTHRSNPRIGSGKVR